WHPTAFLLGFAGFGVGLGTTLELARPRAVAPGNKDPRASLSPEIVVQLGTCCSPGYVMLTTRFDFFFDGPATPVAFSTTMGFTQLDEPAHKRAPRHRPPRQHLQEPRATEIR